MTETKALTLTEFLAARIDEDEGRAQKAQRYAGSELWVMGPMRVLAECAAKRRIMEDFEEYTSDYRAAPSDFAAGRRHAALLALTRVAAVYADHPDYRPEWRP